MRSNNYISKKEHKLLLIVAFITFVLAFTDFVTVTIENYNKTVVEKQEKFENQVNGKPKFEIYEMSRSSLIPFFRLTAIFIFVVLYKSKRFLISTIFTTTIFSIFVYELYLDLRIIMQYKPFSELSFVEQLYLIGNTLDYIVFFLISVLLFWQISILLRMLVKTLRRENILP